MKKRIKNFCISAILALGMLAGYCGGTAGAAAVYVENNIAEEDSGKTAADDLKDPEQGTVGTEVWKAEKQPEQMSVSDTDMEGDPEAKEDTEPEDTETDSEKKENAEPTDPEEKDDVETEESTDPGSDTEPGKQADFRLSVSADEEEIKAGQPLVYEMVLENCGDLLLAPINLQSSFSDSRLKGGWEEAGGLTAASGGGEAILDALEPGERRSLYFTLQVPEEQRDAIVHTIRASAGYREDKGPGEGAGDPEKNGPEEAIRYADPEDVEGFALGLENHQTRIIREEVLRTAVIPLKTEYSVKKTADRSVAALGDTITYQICIRNTGERTLHSVLTTERFQAENVYARFIEKDGVLLNGAKTQALISKIEPGEAFGLQAVVTIPESFTGRELINEVTVVTKETGEQTIKARADVRILETEATKIPAVTEQEDPGLPEEKASMASAASSHPKTGDPAQTEWFAGVLGAAMVTGTGVFCWRKAKRKH